MTPKLTRQQKQHLLHGYTSEAYSGSVPVDIINLCGSFYDNYVYWDMSPALMKSFCSITPGSNVLGPKFKTNINNTEIGYQLIVYPNGSLKRYQGCFEVFFKINLPDFIKNNISEITLYFEILCIETNSEYRNLGKFSKNGLWSNWYPFNMTSSEAFGYDTLSFSCYIDILQIKYKNNNKKIQIMDTNNKENVYNKQIKICRKSEYSWNLVNNVLRQIKYNSHSKRFYSPSSFKDGSWCLYCKPNTFESYFSLYLRLIKLPNKIKRMKVSCQTKSSSIYPENKWISVASFSSKQNSLHLLTLKPSQLLSLTNLLFHVKLEIIEIYDYDQNKISKKHWNEFGIFKVRQNIFKQLKDIIKSQLRNLTNVNGFNI